jgi:hypothetical protein
MHREEAMRLEREKEKLHTERERIERERSELMRMERKRQRLERERLEREREELKRQQMRFEESRRTLKRPYSDRRDSYPEERKRVATERLYDGPARFDDGARFERGPRSEFEMSGAVRVTSVPRLRCVTQGTDTQSHLKVVAE